MSILLAAPSSEPGEKYGDGEVPVGWDGSGAAALVLFQRRGSIETKTFRDARITRPVNRRRIVRESVEERRGEEEEEEGEMVEMVKRTSKKQIKILFLN